MRRRILINASFPGSIASFRGALIRALIEAGYDVHVSAPGLVDDAATQVNALGAISHDVLLQRTGQSVFSDLRYFRSLRRLMRGLRPDYVLGYTVKPNIWGSLAAWSCGIPSASLVTGLGYVFIEGRGWRRKLTQILARFLYRLATSVNRSVIFQNPDDLRDFIAGGALRDQRKAHIVNGSGVDLARYAPCPLNDQPVFLMIARLLHSKGVAEYAEAAMMARAAIPNARFQLAGFIDEGPDAIDRKTLDQWIANGLEYLGPLSDVRPAIAGARIYVLPSWREGTPRTVLEAMAMGRPIITTDAPGCRETVENGVNGLIVPVHRPDALAAAMTELALNPAKAAKMGIASLARVRSKYDADVVAAATIAAMADHVAPATNQR